MQLVAADEAELGDSVAGAQTSPHVAHWAT